MRVTVNGEARELPEGATVAELVAALKLPRDGFAIAVDRAVVPRSAQATTPLREGAAIEVIRAVGGG